MNPMKLWTMTDVGLVRKDNQDAFATRQLESGCTICVVCDGMGGAAAVSWPATSRQRPSYLSWRRS